MFFISLFIFLFVVVGLFLLLKLSPEGMSEDIDKLVNPIEPLGKKAKRIQLKKKENALRRFLKETQDIMKYLGQSKRFVFVCIASVSLSVIGIITAIFLNNLFFIPAFVLGFCSLPFLFVRLYSYSFTKHLKAELESSLSQVTTSYLRLNDIVAAVEENINNMTNPVRKAFEEFVYQIKYVNPNERQAIDDMSFKIEDNIFKEWCESLKKCLENRNLKYLLEPSVEKYSTLRAIENKIAIQLTSIKTSFFMVTLLVYANIPLLAMMNADWFDVLVNTEQGQIALGVIAFITVFEAIILTFITKPLTYKI